MTGQRHVQLGLLAPNPGDCIAVWFSCGAASAVAAKLTLERFGADCEVRVLNNPVIEEHPDNRRFLADIEVWLGVRIESCTNPSYPSNSAVDVWDREKWMGGVRGAPCTAALKRQARQLWEASNRNEWLVMGFTSEESPRADRFRLTERDCLLTPLIDAGMSKADCFRRVMAAGIELPLAYRLGMPNANCLGCCKVSSPTYWNKVRRLFPDVFEARAGQSRRIGARLVEHKGRRIFLDELDPSAVGYRLKNLEYECGIFCEERPAAGGDDL